MNASYRRGFAARLGWKAGSLVVICLLLLGVAVQPARAEAAWTVNPSTGNDLDCASTHLCKTVTAAVGLASAGDTINLAAGTYSGTSGEIFPIAVEKSLTISGAAMSTTTISRTGANQRVFELSGAGTNVTFEKLTLRGGAAQGLNGGAILATDISALTLDAVTVRNNSAYSGGGVAMNAGTLTIVGSTFTSNTAQVYGGAIYMTGGTLSVTGTQFTTNLANRGGAVFASGATGTIAGGSLTGGSANRGAGVYVSNADLTLNGAALHSNTASGTDGQGGAAYLASGSLTLTNGTVGDATAVKHNSAISGAGVYQAGGTLTIRGTALVNNSASGAGGALALAGGTASIQNTTISTNQAGGGAGVYTGGASASLDSVTLANNTGGGVWGETGNLSLTSTLLANNGAANCTGTLVNGGGNIESGSTCGFDSGDSGQPLTLGALALNGGPTLNYALPKLSPAIDAGSSALTSDQRGQARPKGAAADAGAYEYARPVIDLGAASLAYHEGDPAARIGPAAILEDDAAGYPGGTLTFSLGETHQAGDLLEIASGGDGNPITLSDSYVLYNGLAVIGSTSGDGGSAPLSVALTGSASPAAVQALIRAVTFQNMSSSPSTDARSLTVSLDDGAGEISQAPGLAITVTEANLPPEVLAFDKTLQEDGFFTFSPDDFSAAFSDPDGDALVKIKITALPAHGKLAVLGEYVTLNQEIPLASLEVLAYTPDADWFGSDVCEWTATDRDAGPYAAQPAAVNLSVAPVNDLPLLADFSFDGTEDVSLSLTDDGFTDHFNGQDTGDGLVELKISALPSQGELRLDGAAVTLNQVIPIAALDRLTYLGNSNANGADTFQWNASDGLGYAAGPATTTINLAAVNDAPAFSASGDVSVNEDSGAYSNAWATNVSPGAANESSQTLTFTVSNDNNALFSTQPAIAEDGTLTFTPVADAYGSTTVSVSLADDGSSAAPNANASATTTFTVTVQAVNDLPSLDSLSGAAINEDAVAQTVSLSGIGSGAANEDQTLTVTATSSAPAIIPDPTVTYTSADETGTLTYQPAANASGPVTLTVHVTDNGTPARTKDEDFVVNVTAVNDAPTYSLPDAVGDRTVVEDGTLIFSEQRLISIGDVDAGSGDLAVTLEVLHGILNLASTDGFTATSGNGTASVAVTGSLGEINAALDGLTYAPTHDFNGDDTLSLLTNDLGNTGGPANSVNSSLALIVTPVNDAPVITAPASQTVNEDTDWSFSTLSIDDVDAASADLLQVTLTASNGVLTLNPASGVTITAGADASASVTMQGTLVQLNSALNGLHLLAAQDYFGPAGLEIAVNDLGHNGVDTGDPRGASHSVAITVDPVNDHPTFNFIAEADQTVVEDSSARVVSGLATGISAGPANESGQTLSFSTSVPEAQQALFSVQPAVDASGTLRFTPAPDANGVVTATVRLTDSGDGDNFFERAFAITITAVNDAPTFTPGDPVVVNEDSGAYQAGWATQISKGAANESAQTLAFTVSVAEAQQALFSVLPALAADGTLTFTPAADAFGSATVTVTLSDGADSSAESSFTITVRAVNDVPRFTKGADQTVLEDASAQAVNPWATDLVTGPANESGQTLTFLVSNDNPGLFAVQPAVSSAGALTYTPLANAHGVAAVSVQIKDNGGTSNGGVDTSAAQTFTLTLSSVNDVPSFTKGANQLVNEDTGAHQVTGWATGITQGPANDLDGSTLTFNLTNDNNPLFSVQPAVDATTGTLSYTLAGNAAGVATVNVTLSDDGGTANGGQDTSAAQTFTLTVSALNDAPTLTVPAGQSVAEETLLTINGISAADLDAGSDTDLRVSLSVSHGVLTLATTDGLTFAEGGGDGSQDAALTFDGTLAEINAAVTGLQYLPAVDYTSGDTLSLNLSDLGNTGAGDAQTAGATVGITVTPANDAPVNTVPAAQTVAEDGDLVFSGNLAIADPDATAGDSLQVTLTATQGAVTLVAGSGVTVDTAGGTVDGIDDSIVTFTGTKAQLNAALDGLLFEPTPDFNGAAGLQIVTSDLGHTGQGDILTVSDQVTIDVTAVNDTPGFTKGDNPSVAEDAGAQSVSGWASSISKGPADESGQSLTFTVTNDNNGLFLSQPAVAADGTLTYVPAEHAFGTATVSVTLSDNGGGADSSAAQTFTITLSSVNDLPSFTKGANQSVVEDSAAQTASDWASLISAGPGNESTQTLTFTVTNDNNSLFTAGGQPAIDAATNALTYTPAANAFGTATVSVTLRDSGGTANGGVDSSAAQTFTITLSSVNDAPSFSLAGSQTANEDAGPQTVGGFRTNPSAGEFEGETLTWSVTNDNDALFSSQPAIADDGSLTYTPAVNANGSATVTVTATDSHDPSLATTQTFTITVRAINDVPGFTAGAPQSINEDAGAQTVAGWASDISKGPANEATQALTFLASSSNPSLFAVQPAISSTGTLTYTLAADANGEATVTVSLKDSGGTDFDGVDTSAPQTFTITVSAVNDAPANHVPGARTMNEDGGLVFTGATRVTITDDAGALPVQVTLSATSGTLTLQSLTGLTNVLGANGSGSMTYSGTVAAINQALDQLTYRPPLNANGAATLTLTTNDQGNTGAGGEKSDSDTIGVTVSALNDAPVNHVPGAQTTAEDAARVFSSGNGNLISIADVEAPSAQVELSVAHGSLFLSETTGLTFDSGANSSAAMTVSGTLANLNAALDGLRYTPAANYNGADTLTVTTSDLGEAGSGGAQTDSDTVDLTVSAVNDAPGFDLGMAPTVQEDASAQSLVAWVTNISAGPTDENGQTLAFTVTNDNTALFTVQPALAADGTLTYTPAANANGAALVTVVLKDNGATANPGDDDTSQTKTFTISVTAVNDAPGFTGGSDVTVDEDSGAKTVANWATQLSKGPANEDGQTLSFTVTNGNNALFTAQPAIAADGTLSFTPALNANGAALVTVVLSDNGGAAGGGDDSAEAVTFTIAVSAVNDLPTLDRPGNQTAYEDQGATTLSLTGVTPGPVNESGQGVSVTASSSDTAIIPDPAVVYDSDASAWQLSFQPAANTFTTTSTVTSPVSITVTARDDNATPDLPGDDTSVSQVFTVEVNAENDSPIVSGPVSATLVEDHDFVFTTSAEPSTAISASDVDASSGEVQAELVAQHGVVTLAGMTGLAFFSEGDGTADARMTFRGTLAAINGALNGLSFRPDSHFSTSVDLGPAHLQVWISDLGHSGYDDLTSHTNSLSIDLDVTPINDAPVNHVPLVTQTTAEDSALVFSTANGNLISASDVEATSAEITLGVTHGALSLSQTTGLTFTTGDGSDDPTLSATGPLTSLNAALAGLVYTPAANYNGADTLTVTTSDLGEAGSGGAQTDSDTVDLTVTAVNDAPSFSLGMLDAIPEDSPAQTHSAWVSNISAGPDESGQTLTWTVSNTHNALFSAQPAIAADGSLTFTPAANAYGSATVTATLKDDGGALNLGDDDTTSQTFTITVTAVNDAPIWSLPGAQSTLEDTALLFTADDFNPVTLSDDAGDGLLLATLSAGNGVLTLASTSGLAFAPESGDGTADATMTFQATLAQLNSALEGLRFNPTTNYSGGAVISLTVDDQGSHGSGGALTASGEIAVAVGAANDAPVNTVPGSQIINEDTPLIFSGGLSFSVSDVDAGSQALQVTLSAAQGVLTLGDPSAVSFIAGDGSADGAMIISGTLADLNDSLTNLTFTPNQHANGAASITITSDDLGHLGEGGTKTDSDTVNITINPVNDAPVNALPAAQVSLEDTALVFSAANNNSISLTDVEALSAQLSLTVTNGSLSLSQTTGLTFTSGDGLNDATLTASGTLVNLNTALNGLTYNPTLNYTGSDSLSIHTSDLGAAGSGGTKTDSDTVPLTILALNDAPVNTLPVDAQLTAEDSALVFSSANGNRLAIDDADAGTDLLQVTLTATHGTAALPAGYPATITAGEDASASLTFTGTLAQVNGTLNGLTFQPEPDYFGVDASLRIQTSDLEHNGSGGAQTDSDTLSISVTPVNDVPVFSAGSSQTVLEDAGAQTVAAWATAISSGAANESGQALTFEVTGNTFPGLFEVLPAVSAGGVLTYKPLANANGEASLTLRLVDDGDTLNGGANTTATQQFTITVTAVNDAPSFTAGGAVTVDEDSGAYSAAWATSLSKGPANEDGQTLSFTVTNDHHDLFAAQPAIAPDGTLSFTPALNANGSALVTVVLSDNGGAAGGGDDSAEAVTFTLTVNALNDPPTLDDPADQTVDEDANLTTLTLSGISAGPANEAGQSLSVTASSSDPSIVPDPAVVYDSDAGAWQLSFQPAANAFTSDPLTITVTVNDGEASHHSFSQTFSVAVTSLNDAPVNALPGGQTTAEDVPLTFSSASGNPISTADTEASTAEMSLSVIHGTLSLSQTTGLTFTTGDGTNDPTLSATGTLTSLNAALDGLVYSPAANYNGADSLSVTTSDLGSLGDGGTETDTDTVSLTVTAVNDAPTFELGTAPTVPEDAAAQSLAGWAHNLSAGPSDESGQTLIFTVTNDNHTLFAAGGQPAITAEGTLTYTPAPNANGSALVSVVATDNGSTTNPGDDNTSVTKDFILAITVVNDAPGFTGGGDTSVAEDSGPAEIAAWASAITKGPANESGQTLTFNVTDNTNASLFTALGQPAVDPLTGTLAFTPAVNAFGYADVTLSLSDSAGGADTSAPYTFTIVVSAVNDAPGFTKGADQTAPEDAPAQTVSGWATAIKVGPANENGQQLDFIVSADPAALFTVQPAISAMGVLTYTPKANADGVATVTVRLHDDGGTALGGLSTSEPQTFTIALGAANDAPVNHLPANQTTHEDAALVFSSANGNALSIDDDSGANPISAQLSVPQGSLTLGSTTGLTVTGNGSTVVQMSGTLAAINAGLNGLSYTPPANLFDLSVSLTLTVDDGGFTGGGDPLADSDSLTISVTPVNDAPSFLEGADEIVSEDVGPRTVTGWAAAISPGLGDETDQGLTFEVSNDQNSLFLVQPALNPLTGTLTYTPADNAFGAATVTVRLKDDGGTANGGVDTSAEQTFTIAVNPVNDAPGFTKGPDVTVLEDSAQKTVSGWATNLSKGPVNEAGQALSFNVSLGTGQDSLFTPDGQPMISADGRLSFTPAANAAGAATASVTLSDDGGLDFDGVDTSAPQSFTITLTAVNDAPGFTAGGAVTVDEDSGAYSAVWATGITAGPPDESAQVLAFAVSVPADQQAMFTVLPAVSSGGLLTFTPAADASGDVTATVTLSDNGGTAGGADTLAAQDLMIHLTALNDAPMITVPGGQTIAEDSQRVFGGANLISITDVDVAASTAQLALSVEHGTLTLNDLTGLSFVTGDGTTDAALTISGTLSSINNALNGLVYTPAANYNGLDTLSLSASDLGATGSGGTKTDSDTVALTVTAVNDVPSFTKGADQSAAEDSLAQTVTNWASNLSAGPADESGQTLAFNVTNDNHSLFTAAGQPAINAITNTLTYLPAPDAFGTATVSVTLSDSGGGADTSAAQTFTITITPVNDLPAFTAGGSQTVAEDPGPTTVAGWATNISNGPANEDGQTRTFLFTSDHPEYFSNGPAVDPDSGDLTFTPAANRYGTAVLQVALEDSGGGADTSTPHELTITITAANDAPGFTLGANPSATEGGSAQSLPGWMTGISAGPYEDGQTITWSVSNNNNAVFSAQPALDPATGTLTFTPASGGFGSAIVTVTATDNGTPVLSQTDTFTITIDPINHVPSFTKGADQEVNEDAGAQFVAGWAGAISAGLGDSGQELTFEVSNNNPGLFSLGGQPSLSSGGALSYTPADNAFGAATVSVRLKDDGGTANGGVDTCAEQTFTITVNPVNDAPGFTKGSDVTVAEDAGSQSVSGWAGAISAGLGENTQNVTFDVSVPAGKAPLFAALPQIAADGTLTFRLVDDANTWNAATHADEPLALTVTARDDGGTAASGVDVSAAQSFNLTVTPVNDAPTLNDPADRSIVAGSGPLGVSLTGIGEGAPDETEAVSISVVSDNTDLFPAGSLSVVGPAPDGTAALTLTLAAGQSGEATITVTVDDGLLSAQQSFAVSVLTTGILVDPTSGLETTETGGTATFNVSLVLLPAAEVTVSVNSSDIAEGTVSPETLTFTAGNYNVPQVITITGVDDDIDDGYATVHPAYQIDLSAASSDPNYNGTPVSPVSVTNIDEDTAGYVVEGDALLITGEDGRQASFDVYLLSQPVADVTLTLYSSNPAEGTLSPSVLSFNPANWSDHQTVTVSGVNDSALDGNVNYTVRFNASDSADGYYDDVTLSPIAAINWDNEVVRTEITPTTGGILTFAESGGAATTVNVPGGTVDSQVYMSLASTGAPGSMPGLIWARRTFVIAAHTAGGAPVSDLSLKKAITVTVEYTDAQIDDVREDSLALYRGQGNGWAPAACGPVTREPNANRLIVPVCELGTFALFGEKNDYSVFIPLLVK